MKKILFAVPKGRILQELEILFDKINLQPEAEFFDEKSRKLVFATNFINLEIVKVRSFDVATFVRFGAADIGVCGLDVIEEFSSPEIFPLLDLGIGKCRLSIAAKSSSGIDFAGLSHIRIATKYTDLASKYFAEKGIQAELIKLNGAIEIAPQLGLCDFIIDLVDSGKTLKENNMIELEKIIEISSYLIANRTSFKTKNTEINALLKLFDGK